MLSSISFETDFNQPIAVALQLLGERVSPFIGRHLLQVMESAVELTLDVRPLGLVPSVNLHVAIRRDVTSEGPPNSHNL
jgi:hypothetical protein